MLYHIANPRDGYGGNNCCNTCCCEPLPMRPGEVNLLRINYNGWTVQMAEKGLTVNTWFDVEKLSPEIATGGNSAVIVTPAQAMVTPGVSYAGSLVGNATDPEGDTLTWKVLPLYGAQHGEFVLNADGTYTYISHSGYVGTDLIYYSVTDGDNATIGSLMVGVGNVPSQAMAAPAPVSVNAGKKKISCDMLDVPIAAAVDAKPGDFYKLSVRQEAMNCEGVLFYHVSCFDVNIGRC